MVETTHGKIRGADIEGIRVFKGVRYADTTAGANRFCPPQPPPKWPGIIDALSWGPSAPQSAVPQNTDPFYSWYSAIQPISEDCLSLNVFTPACDRGKRPVLFWIHGGGWREFSGTAPGFDGTNFSRAEDVVVVTVNHRLNAFGFLNLSGSDDRFADSTNAGLLDIVMALRWVCDNIQGFGGDPGNVTVFGESGGASKIAALLAMRAARGLFHKAIIQSSAGGMQLATPEETDRLATSLAKELGWAKLEATALQNIPMDKLLTVLKRVPGTFRGAIDGRSFDKHPYFTKAPETSSRVPVLAGCTTTETTYHLRFGERSFALAAGDVKKRIMRFMNLGEVEADQLIGTYSDVYPYETPTGLLTLITSDYVFKRNTYRIAALQAASAITPVYAYLFDRDCTIEKGRMRSTHTSEIPFIFGTTAAAEACIGTGSDIAPLTKAMMATWAAFARHGDPNNVAVPHWKPFTDGDRQTMVLNAESRSEIDPGGRARAALEHLPYFSYGHSIDAFVMD
jgi:para-nitrobenzyl esterase